MKTAEYWIKKLELEKHPEGGWFKEIYRSDKIIVINSLPEGFTGLRNFSTSIYYLIAGEDFSAFHRIKSDEIWHYYAGSSSVEIISIVDGQIKKQLCGNKTDEGNQFQVIVPKNTWFAARLSNQDGYALVGCTVSPGFHFDDFEIAGKSLLKEYPDLKKEIEKLIRL